MAWHATLRLDYRHTTHAGVARTLVRDRHDGPLRVLASLYPEAQTVCHNVLVHPPGGIVGGDVLAIEIDVAEGAHALVTSAGATRFYRTTGAAASQSLRARVADGARLEWLPLETIAYSGCVAENRTRFDLAPTAQAIGWDVLALGLPASGAAFERGRFTQALELPGRWTERGVVDAGDTRLLDSPLGWAGRRVLGTLWIATGAPFEPALREALLDVARSTCAGHLLDATAGASAADPGIVVLRVLGPRVEPVMQLLGRVWAAWRACAWNLPACVPRVWRT
jgi:urease accessory protein